MTEKKQIEELAEEILQEFTNCYKENNMATCNDCIHANVCVILACPDAFENTKWDKEPCDHFKPTANFVPKNETATEIANLIKGVVEFDISLSDSETEYLLFRIDEVLKEYLEEQT